MLVIAMTFAGCNPYEKVVYMQDVTNQDIAATELQMIRVRPGDRLTILVSSKNPELCLPFHLLVNQRTVRTDITSMDLSSTGDDQSAYFTVSSNGTIDYPVFGSLYVADMTREQVAAMIKQRIIEGDYIKDPIVTIEFSNLTFSVLGDVNNPGQYRIGKDRVTLIEGLSLAGDLSITGRRDNVLVLREQPDGSRKTYRVDLTNSSRTFNTPAYYLQQNDIVYVEPNNVKIRQSTANGNTLRTPAFWMSMASFAMTVIIFLK